MAEPDRRSPTAESTLRLCERIREGDNSARAVLIERYFAALHRWARGRLPRYARSEMNTEDLVQETLLRALARLEGFEPGETGSFLAYLRQILKNRIRDEVRKVQRRPRPEELDESIEESGPSPMEQAIDAEKWGHYEKGLAQLAPQQRDGVIMRVELQFSHQEVADALGMRTANAARMMVSRAIEKLVETMDDGDGPD
jgi:RNA polymerase sigma-70 factor (ECF subfamily)